MPLLKRECPDCGQEPVLMVGDSQWMCGNSDCSVIFWNPSLADGGNSNRQEVTLTHLPGPSRDSE